MTRGPASALAEEYGQSTHADGGVVPLVSISSAADHATVAALVAGEDRPYASDADRREAALELLEDNAPGFVAKALDLDLATVRALHAHLREETRL